MVEYLKPSALMRSAMAEHSVTPPLTRVAVVDDLTQQLFISHLIDLQLELIVIGFALDKAEVLGDGVIEDQAADRSFDDLCAFFPVQGIVRSIRTFNARACSAISPS